MSLVQKAQRHLFLPETKFIFTGDSDSFILPFFLLLIPLFLLPSLNQENLSG